MTATAPLPSPQTLRAPLVIYGGTPSGAAAAIAAARDGTPVLLLEQHTHVGGLNTSGLNNNEQHHMSPRETFGGICLEFFTNLALHYPETWGKHPGWFNSGHFETELLRLLDHPLIAIRFRSLLASADVRNSRLLAITLEDGCRVEGEVFIDASYEGDLLAAAGVPWRLGREARSDDEPLAGVTWTDPVMPIDPYDADGLLPGLSPEPMPEAGSASPQVQNINFRVTLTDRDDIRVPIPKPTRYDPREHELLARSLEAGAMTALKSIIGLYPLPNRKFECNNNQRAVISLSQRAIATQWPTASHAQRDRIWQDLREYNLGLFRFLATDPRVPADMQQQMRTLGLPADDYTDNGHWPHEVYVRIGRRLAGRYTMTQRDIQQDRTKPDTIALGSHYIDSHWVDRYPVGREGFRNEGRLWQEGMIFELPYRCMLPPEDTCDNLLVPVAVSASNVAMCAIRLEPTWMQLGEAAGLAAGLALETDQPVGAISTQALQRKLVAANQQIHLPPSV